MLLSDQCVHTIKMAVFDGSVKSVFRDRKELSGSLLEQPEDAYAYIDSFNRTRAEFEGLDRIDKRDYPPEALREALLNAGITFDDIMLGVSVLRNRHLANVFYRLRLIEETNNAFKITLPNTNYKKNGRKRNSY